MCDRFVLATSMLLTLVVSLSATRSAQAIDQVIRKSSANPVRGKITAISKTGLTVKPQVGADVMVPANDIVDVRWDGEPVKLITARGADRASRYTQALKAYADVESDPKAAADNINKDLKFLVARATAGQALAGAGKLEDARAKLEAFLQVGATSFRYFDAVGLLGRVELAAGSHDKAKAQFTALAGAPWLDYKMAGQSAQARVLLAQGNVDGALSAFQAVITQGGNNPDKAIKGQRFQAVLGKSSCLIRKQGQASFTAALKDLDGVLAEASDSDSRVLAEAYLRQGDCLRLLGRQKEAVLSYLHVDLLFAAEATLHAESLFHLGTLWSAVGHPDRASSARERLRSDYPQSSWAKKLGS
ncbi:MAG TPA: hypothetical protein DCE47_06090 [Planctomycetaceae bacterium]|nr:hypothetical protein [Planctomycetaceae bacterium]HCC99462.1 hypothetical protein [Planctomycetaceae bacterium]